MKYQRIEDMRIDHDLTQKQIAMEIGCNREVYRRYESGVREVPVWILIALAKYYDCSTDYLLGISDTKRRFGK
ncbi:MAG: helix-turn-helix domain-containing protein [Lachnospiraceae bacterium]|nr:helix-turn-helix domain-containing protein [Lachnospiraceae bacterium]